MTAMTNPKLKIENRKWIQDTVLGHNPGPAATTSCSPRGLARLAGPLWLQRCRGIHRHAHPHDRHPPASSRSTPRPPSSARACGMSSASPGPQATSTAAVPSAHRLPIATPPPACNFPKPPRTTASSTSPTGAATPPAMTRSYGSATSGKAPSTARHGGDPARRRRE